MATSSVEDFPDAAEASRPELPGLLGSAETTGAGQQQATFVAGAGAGERKGGQCCDEQGLANSEKKWPLALHSNPMRVYEVELGSVPGMGALVAFVQCVHMP
jgi:hypothetical protein